tara:strand:+ start:2206 stop:2430 length:225 start_codon:yes stop_codon:yes gene_type:complete
MRRRLIALALASIGFLAIALGSKQIDGPDWVVFGGLTLAVYALVHLLLFADWIACEADRRMRADRSSDRQESFT